MNPTISTFSSESFFGVLSLLLGFVGVVLAIVLYLIGRRVKSPYFASLTYQAFKDINLHPEQLKVIVSGKDVQRLSITKIVYWNAGRDPIKQTDVAEPFRVCAKPDVSIIKAKIIAANNSSNDCHLEWSEAESDFILNFKYLDKGDGCVLVIFHTGLSDDDLTINGRVIGAGVVQRKQIVGRDKISDRSLTLKMYLWLGLLMCFMFYGGIILFIGLLALVFSPMPLKELLTKMPKDLFHAFGNLFYANAVKVLILFSIGYLLLMPKRRVPKGLEIFEEKF